VTVISYIQRACVTISGYHKTGCNVEHTGFCLEDTVAGAAVTMPTAAKRNDKAESFMLLRQVVVVVG